MGGEEGQKKGREVIRGSGDGESGHIQTQGTARRTKRKRDCLTPGMTTWMLHRAEGCSRRPDARVVLEKNPGGEVAGKGSH